MYEYQSIKVIEMSSNLAPFNVENFTEFISCFVSDLSEPEKFLKIMVEEAELTMFDGMDSAQILETAILTACQNMHEDVEFDKIASRLAVVQMYQTSLNLSDSDFKNIYSQSFVEYIHNGIEQKLLNPELDSIFDLDMLARNLVPENDDLYTYIGLDTLHKRYAIHSRGENSKTLETPQFMWMRIAMGLALKEENPNEVVKDFYKIYSTLKGIPGGSTNIGSGTTVSVLSNCYLIDTEDDIDSIYDNIKNIALISKATGGIGISVTKLRASGSPVRSNNTTSTGPIPFIKVMDTALKSMSRAGKKFGATAIYMENWHFDFDDFLDLRVNAGDDYRRIRTADTAVYISDEFMKRVIKGEDWYMFDPLDVPDLTELYGSAFSARYMEYINMANRGEIVRFKKIPAMEQMKRIVTTLLSTSHPWLTWKDTINLRALNNNTGTIHTSNLCTEICLPQDRNNIAVCNLFHINLSKHILDVKTDNWENLIDWAAIKETVSIGMRHLDNLIENNEPPVKEAKKSDTENRAVGFGMMGLAEVFEKAGVSYDSEIANQIADRITEFVSYHTIEASCDLAEERGSYKYFDGSMWSKGFVPIDSINVLDKDRNSQNATVDPLVELKAKIEEGIQNARSQDSKDLYELFDKLSSLIPSTTKVESTNTSEFSVKQDRKNNLNWDVLRERVKKGVRNATTMCIAPNASSGLLAGTTPGIDPRFSNIFSRATSRGKFLDINVNLVKILQDLGLWDTVKQKVIENYGDISEIEEIPEDVKEIYKTSFQVSPYAFIEVASRAQKWIDQAISRNMYLETREVDDLVQIYTEAWRRGLKTTYYLHTKPRHTAEQSRSKVNKSEKIVREKLSSSDMADGGKTVSKGFGFSSQNKSIQVNHVQNVKTEEVIPSVGFASSTRSVQPQAGEKVQDVAGVSSVQAHNTGFAQSAERTSTTFESKWKPLVGACPVDPNERAMCEGCQ